MKMEGEDGIKSTDVQKQKGNGGGLELQCVTQWDLD